MRRTSNARHQLSAIATSIRDADQILVLDGAHRGNLGRHEALTAGNGVYAELFREQPLESRECSPFSCENSVMDGSCNAFSVVCC